MNEEVLKQKLIEIGQKVDPYINELLTSGVDSQTADMVIYQCQMGGKRVRPALLTLCGNIFGADENELMYASAAIEILHNSTLITDDIIDHSEFRRNKPTCWKKYGRSMAECMVLDYVPAIFEGLAKMKNSEELIKLYSKTLKTIVDGEIKDILFERSGRNDEPYIVTNRYQSISMDDYRTMVSQKTAVLLQACCEAGAIIANANAGQRNSLSQYGFNIGMAFQIQDDILDIFADEKEFGKKVGKDIIEKKLGNFVILSAIEEMPDGDRDYVLSILNSSEEATDEVVSHVINLINKTNAKEKAQAAADNYIQSALSILDSLPQNESTKYLADLAKYIIERKV